MWARFSALVQTEPRDYTASYTMVTRSFPGAKWPGRGVDCPPLFSAEVKERVELYLYSKSGTSWPVIGCTLPFTMKEYPNRITRSEGFKAVDINPVVYWVITLRCLVDFCQSFGGIY